ncbi:uncharacterized protein A4U43_C02F5960 [Asparagus officinalis]|uniref:Uncharacterized protein n=1 Tax=Asparagus officinalis TaxID=4686 RepID=A0A5P1FI45_ASPOF|nr:uncharacterized protein A4U43_C02F5960 [Asparagus officinalis]
MSISNCFVPILISLLLQRSVGVLSDPQVPALFVFGDSLADDGNNNYMSSIAKANYYPYGIDFFQGPTGRFGNGKTAVDILWRKVQSKSASTKLREQPEPAEIPDAGRRPEPTSRKIHRRLRHRHGSNDYINNYLLPFLYPTRSNYTPEQYANLLLNRYARQLLALYDLGLRKFFLVGIGPLGCTPNQRATGLGPPGRCVDQVNQMLGPFNVGLRTLAQQLNTNHPGAIFVYGNTYGALGDILNNPSTYGFTVIDRACCGLGRNQGQITCLPFAVPCSNRDQHVFWDAFHPTQAVNMILAQRAFTGPPTDCFPINVQQMAQL